MGGFVAMVAGAALAINQGAQWFWTKQQASIAAQEATKGHEYAYQHIGSPVLAAVGVAIFMMGFAWFCSPVLDDLRVRIKGDPEH